MDKRIGKTKLLVLAALFAALTAIGAFLQIPLGFTSITLQFFFTAMAGILLGARYGALSQLCYVALGLIGLPIFTQGGGLGYLLKPSCGFLFGLIAAAWVIGLLTQNAWSTRHPSLRIALACLAGSATLYLFGVPYMYVILNFYMDKALSFGAVLVSGMLVFLPGDAVKIAFTVALSRPLHQALSRL